MTRNRPESSVMTGAVEPSIALPHNILIIWGDDIGISNLSRTLDCGKLLNDFQSPKETLET
jgi:hypothetical protein